MDADDSCFEAGIQSLCQSFTQANISDRRRNSLVSQNRRLSSDRFIPVRRGSDVENCYRRLMTSQDDCQESVCLGESGASGGVVTWKGSTATKPRSASISDDRILAFSPRESTYAGKDNQKRQGLSTPKGPTPKRYLPKYPTNIMAMPDIRDDFYCHIMTWSANDELAVAVGGDVFTLNTSTNVCKEFTPDTEDLDSSPVICLAWNPSGKLLAIGTEAGDIRVSEEFSNLMCFDSHNYGKTNAVAWNRKAAVVYGLHDKGILTVNDVKLQTVLGHNLHLTCSAAGLKIHPDNKKLAIGANDGTVLVWSLTDQDVLVHIQAHSVATKVLEWVPWRTDTLVTAGALGDGSVKVWDMKTGHLLEKTETNSQVCSMVISETYRELMTGHGLEHSDILFWSLPHLHLLGRLQHHKGRVLQLCLNVKETTLVSLGADELLVFWDCFEGATKPVLRRRGSCPMSCLSPLTFSLR